MGRSYTIDDVEMPSVTTVLGILDKSEALIPWAVRQATRFVRENKGERDRFPTLDALLEGAEGAWRQARDTAGDIGSEAHAAIERYVKGGVGDDSMAFTAFRQWEDAHGVTWRASELSVHHPAEFYAGTLDAICLIDGKVYVVDFKTSGAFYDTFGMQIAAYLHAARAMGIEVEGAGILRLDKKTGLPEWRDYSHRIERDYAAFLHLLDYWYSAAARKLKNNPRVSAGRIPRREKERFDARTVQQNRYYRGLLRILMSYTGNTMEEVHDFVRGLFHYKSVIISDVEMKTLLSTTLLDIGGMIALIDNLRLWQQQHEPDWYLPTVEEWMLWDAQDNNQGGNGWKVNPISATRNDHAF